MADKDDVLEAYIAKYGVAPNGAAFPHSAKDWVEGVNWWRECWPIAQRAVREAINSTADMDYTYASKLAYWMHEVFYSKESPELHVLPTLNGVLSQIDNMLCGLQRKQTSNSTAQQHDKGCSE